MGLLGADVDSVKLFTSTVPFFRLVISGPTYSSEPQAKIV